MTVYFFITAFVVVIAAGTEVPYMLVIGLGQGHRAVPMAACGCAMGILPHLLAAIFGLTTLLHQSSLLFAIVNRPGSAIFYILDGKC